MVSLTPAVKTRFSCLRPAKGEYCRIRQLPGLLKMWPSELEDYSYPGTLRIVALLRKALRAERCRARMGHWAYDLNRHIDLTDALKHERERLKMLERGLPWRGSKKPAASGSSNAGTLRLPSLKNSGAALSPGS